ncbi:hypothetical protein A5780_30360 [Nocardia sp. 852002-20019_SCH5090214]|uniref:ATP dependent DNA ligase n=1 Tax=Nocardia TaxID=1817 RepID=UPI0007E9B49D|nr:MULTISPECIES: hypothetical protein [Nocardia]MCC3316703.1 hypothetical protein [Nocardia africana]OBA50911.1 hypothetical protein A5780_30360 [Nocardia sp. 852002-20019_SCH5090214]
MTRRRSHRDPTPEQFDRESSEAIRHSIISTLLATVPGCDADIMRLVYEGRTIFEIAIEDLPNLPVPRSLGREEVNALFHQSLAALAEPENRWIADLLTQSWSVEKVATPVVGNVCIRARGPRMDQTLEWCGWHQQWNILRQRQDHWAWGLCPVCRCRLELSGGRPRKFCSDRCRQAGRRTRQTTDAVVGGWIPSLSRPRDRLFGALILGAYDASDELVHTGTVSTGFSPSQRRELQAQLDEIAQEASSFAEPPQWADVPAHWVEPRLVATVHYHDLYLPDFAPTYTHWVGLRVDRDPIDVRLPR